MATSMVFCIGDLGQSSLLLRNHAHFHLHQGAGSRKCFLEKLQSIIVVQDLDSFRQCNLLFSTHLHVCLVLLLLRGAVCVQVREELLVLSQGLLGITQISFHLHDFDTQIPNADRLLFNGACQGLHLFGLGSHQRLIGLDCCRLRGLRLCKAFRHCVLHLLQNPCNFTTLWGVPVVLLCGKEGHKLFTVIFRQCTHVLNHVAQNLSRLGLQKSCHAFLERGDCCCQCGNIGASIGLHLCKLGCLFLPDCCC
mmetsp:Transcript_96895/g.177510  ORF Transcript_96895/g.177510 Transcript_96895/m.177510 type:complete len:251 (+) Transcript_96895:412-1164(+)